MLHSLSEPIREAIEAARTPSAPQIILRLLRLVDDDQASMSDVARLIEQDPGLCARMLAAANASSMQRGRPIRNMESCLRALGHRQIRVIATCLAVQHLIDEHMNPRIVDLSVFWAHSMLVAELARAVAVAVAYPQPEEAYLAGLLHDIGQLLLVEALGEPYLQLLAGCTDEAALPEQELRDFGTHHGEVGTCLADSWQIDSPFADGILYHHLPAWEIAGATVLPQVVWLAHALTGSEEIPDTLVSVATQMFPEIDRQRLLMMRSDAEKRIWQAANALGINPADGTVAGGAAGLPRLRKIRQRSEMDPQAQLVMLVGHKALLQTLQQDLLAIEGNAELLLALRETARLLFDLPRIAFLLGDPANGQLSGQDIHGQAPIFSQLHHFADPQSSLLILAAASQQICSSFDPQTAVRSMKDLQFARAFASAGLLCIPMLSGTRCVGVIVAGVSAGRYARLARRLPVLANFGRIAGTCLEERRLAQSIREQSEAAAALRFTRQARRIIHEAGNPLTIIKGYLRLLDGKLPPEAEVRHELAVLGEEIERVSSIIQRMSDAPQQEIEDASMDIGDQLREILLLYRESLFDGRGIQIETLFPSEPIRVCCDGDSIKQILLNLWKNASEALGHGQTLTLSLTDNIFHQGRHFAELRLADNGPGISTTALKALHQLPGGERGDGPRGIGLSIVGSLTQRLGIPVTCRSQAGEGTIISLLLPTVETVEHEKEKRVGAPLGEQATRLAIPQRDRQ